MVLWSLLKGLMVLLGLQLLVLLDLRLQWLLVQGLLVHVLLVVLWSLLKGVMVLLDLQLLVLLDLRLQGLLVQGVVVFWNLLRWPVAM